jgi:O-antigen/teichoic acid export membrane protein
MNPRQIFLNAVTTSAQVVASAAILFFLYRFLIRSIGMERLGIWSLVLATTSIVALAHQGFSTSIIKFVAKYAAREERLNVSLLIQTAAISAAVAVAAIAIALYPIARWILSFVVPRPNLFDAYAILPFALLSLWCNVVQGVLQAGLAGHQWITTCNYLEISGAFSYLLLVFVLVPRHGLLGVAAAQSVQTASFLVLTWLLLRRKIPQLPLLPHRWNRHLFREIASYGLHFQFITACQSFREPVTKALIAKFGGLALTGFYDLASRWVVTFRELIVQADQVLVPAISHLQERNPESLPAIYRESYRIVFFLAIPTFSAIAVLAPVISRVWIGRYEPVFVEFIAVLACAWLVNVLANPSYTFDLGTGTLRPVTIGCAATAVFNAFGGFFAGHFFGGTAVVLASGFALAAGYIFIVAAHHRQNRISLTVLVPSESRTLLVCSVACAAVLVPVLFSRDFSLHLSLSSILLVATAPPFFLLIPLWRHPVRRRLFRWAVSHTPRVAGNEAS